MPSIVGDQCVGRQPCLSDCLATRTFGAREAESIDHAEAGSPGGIRSNTFETVGRLRMGEPGVGPRPSYVIKAGAGRNASGSGVPT